MPSLPITTPLACRARWRLETSTAQALFMTTRTASFPAPAIPDSPARSRMDRGAAKGTVAVNIFNTTVYLTGTNAYSGGTHVYTGDLCLGDGPRQISHEEQKGHKEAASGKQGKLSPSFAVPSCPSCPLWPIHSLSALGAAGGTVPYNSGTSEDSYAIRPACTEPTPRQHQPRRQEEGDMSLGISRSLTPLFPICPWRPEPSPSAEHDMLVIRPGRRNADTELCRSLNHRATTGLYSFAHTYCDVAVRAQQPRINNSVRRKK